MPKPGQGIAHICLQKKYVLEDQNSRQEF